MDADDLTMTAPGVHGARSDLPDWLGPRLAWLDLALHREILRLRSRYELSLDELRGLYVSDEQVDRLVERRMPDAATAAAMRGLDEHRRDLVTEPGDPPLAVMTREFDLADAEVVAVLACLAAEVDPAYSTLYAYLNDDVGRPLPTVDLCRRLADDGGGEVAVQPHDPLVATGLVSTVPVPHAPLWLTTGLLLSEPARRFLLGLDPLSGARRRRVSRPRLVLLESRWPDDARAAARELTRHDHQALVEPDPDEPDPTTRLGHAVLRARLHGAALFVPGLPDLATWRAAVPEGLGEGRPDAGDAGPAGRVVERLVEAPVTVLLHIRPREADRLPLACVDHQHLVVDRPDAATRRDLWALSLARHGVVADRDDMVAVADLFGMGPSQIDAAALAVAREPHAGRTELCAAARSRAWAGLGGLAERVDPSYTWDDLVLPTGTARRLRDLQDAVLHRHRVYDDWGLGRLVGGHTSVRALFSGQSGTGKTMAASVVAAQVGLELHRVDLSAVVSKYIGETEKNLDRVFRAAEDCAAMLFFDEADALFGKRTEVKDAHDRYANIETSFMLQRMEGFDGVVVLATNLAANLDEAFSRRIQFRVDFPVPDRALLAELWRKALPPQLPVEDDVDPDFLAGMFAMTGGEVRSAALGAAFAAAAEGTPLGMRHLVAALARLRRQQGKVPSASEFKGYLHLAHEERTG
jgi:hypothetical protein